MYFCEKKARCLHADKCDGTSLMPYFDCFERKKSLTSDKAVEARKIAKLKRAGKK